MGVPKDSEKREQYCKKISDRMKAKFSSVGEREKVRLSLLGEKNPNFGKHHNPEWCKRISDALTGRKLSQKHRESISKAHQGYNNHSFGRIISAETRKKISESKLGKSRSPETILKMSIANTGKIIPPDVRKKMQDAVIKRYAEYQWYGSITYRNDGIYCEKWKDVNQRAKAFFNYTCVVCGEQILPKTGTLHKFLIGHHVFYEKQSCCMINDNGIYYTSLNVRNHKKDYLIGENPNYFVILCNSCHGKTNGKYENRKKYADMFRDIIDTQYAGKCYFTKEEWESMK